jgi:hypothetical protein
MRLHQQKGTAAGELIGLFGTFKSFPVSVMMTQASMMMSQKTGVGKVAYGSSLLVGMTVLGALALQMKEIAKGRDPRPMDTWDFWLASMLQGGGVGLFGDLIFSDANRFGGGLTSTFAGPTVGLLNDTWKLTAGNIQEMAQGDDTDFIAETIKYAKKYNPVFNQFYINHAFDRVIFDTIEDMADIGIEKKRRKAERKREADYGNSSWWKAGEYLPSRAPSVEDVIE